MKKSLNKVFFSFFKKKRRKKMQPVRILINPREPFKIDVVKFKSSPDITLGQFMISLRNYCKLDPSEALFPFIVGKNGRGDLLPVSMTMGNIQSQYGDNEKIVNIILSKENTFG